MVEVSNRWFITMWSMYGHRAVYFGKDTGEVVPGVFMLKKTIEKLEPIFKDEIGSTIKAEFE